ncbi:30S ribosomal protein S2 [bacterium]|nr:30S ribosomal protein S2 [bacterium]|tara:strand:+ start:4575 stop:5270 length:696 start_codon:yes stop_codon:yes gene_type:complete
MAEKLSDSTTVDEMFEAGAHLAFTRARRHASVKDFVFGKKHNLDVLDLKKTEDLLGEAEKFVKGLAESGKTLLFVGTKPEAKGIIEAAAKEAQAPYVSERWIGGLLTNFTEVRKRIERLTELKKEKAEGGLDKYTKKEQGVIAKEMGDLERKFGGVEGIDKTPDALFVVDSKEEDIAVTEAVKMGVPVVSLSGSDCDIRKITYPIVANDASLKSIEFFVERIKNAYKEGKE